jgi:beta-lactam-binding protein with PASTA domain
MPRNRTPAVLPVVLLAMTGLTGLAGCSLDSAPAGTPIPGVVGQSLKDARQSLEDKGFGNVATIDVGGKDHQRAQIVDSHWRVCAEDPAGGSKGSGTTLVTLRVVKLGEDCPSP